MFTFIWPAFFFVFLSLCGVQNGNRIEEVGPRNDLAIGFESSHDLVGDASFVGRLKQLFFSANKSSSVKTVNSTNRLESRVQEVVNSERAESKFTGLYSDHLTSEVPKYSNSIQKSLTTMRNANASSLLKMKEKDLGEAVERADAGKMEEANETDENLSPVEESSETFSTVNFDTGIYHTGGVHLAEDSDEDMSSGFRPSTPGSKKYSFTLINQNRKTGPLKKEKPFNARRKTFAWSKKNKKSGETGEESQSPDDIGRAKKNVQLCACCRAQKSNFHTQDVQTKLFGTL